jgi:ABC-type cobalamin/Fe3+-siderophores transport system ATPase subunit
MIHAAGGREVITEENISVVYEVMVKVKTIDEQTVVVPM